MLIDTMMSCVMAIEEFEDLGDHDDVEYVYVCFDNVCHKARDLILEEMWEPAGGDDDG